MSLLLHISDLHLASLASEPVGDYKVEAIPAADRQTRIGLIRQTLEALESMLVESHQILDAVIVMGDVTTHAEPLGFNQLPDLLATLRGSLPPADHILVVPGNHDVRWRTPPGSVARYEAFAALREFGYATPLLEGLDRDSSAKAPGPVVLGPDYAIALINSADMCGVEEPLSSDAESELAALGPESADLVAAVRRLRLYDMPRVSPWQLIRLAEILRGVHKREHQIRIAALHHHLLPVRTDEEAKPFESIVNLGEVRAFLADGAIDLVLHGHKHYPAVLEDWPNAVSSKAPHRQLIAISSCSTIGGGAGAGSEVARLVRINSDLPVRRSFVIESIAAVPAGVSVATGVTTLYRSGLPQTAGPGLTQIVGRTVSDVHEQILQLRDAVDGQPVNGLACTVEDGASCLLPPETYPSDIPDPRATWFEEIVTWWQDSQVETGKPFTHGQRLRRWPRDIDQVRSAIEALQGDLTTSRAVAVLVDPVSDRISDHAIEFPSFVLIQFRVIGSELECTASFRKQEMRYWWAINVSEVAHLQREALSMLVDKGLSAGAIRTIAGEAVFSASLPKVSIPRIDRLAWREPPAIWKMALAVADLNMPGRNERIRELEAVIGDWLPPAADPPRDGAAIPERGLEVLHEALQSLAAAYGSSRAADTAAIVLEMLESSRTFATSQRAGAGYTEYAAWRERQHRLLNRLSTLLASGQESAAG